MTRKFAPTLLTTVLASSVALATSTYAATGLSVGDMLGTDENTIVQTLEAAGYTDIEIETEDGVLEVEASYEGEEIEIEISADEGKILEIETDDDADENDKS